MASAIMARSRAQRQDERRHIPQQPPPQSSPSPSPPPSPSLSPPPLAPHLHVEGRAELATNLDGVRAELQEARTGLRMGKKLEQARIIIGHRDYEYSFTLAAALMEFRNVKLPKTETTENDKSDNPEEIEGMILERVFLFEELIKLVNGLFRMFLDVRLSEAWRDELQKIRAWVAKSDVVV